MTTERIDPPEAADEVTMLRSYLDFYRATLRRQCEDLDAEQLNVALAPSTMTLGGMLKHLAFVEHAWFRDRFAGDEDVVRWPPEEFDADPDWDWHSAVHDSPEELLAGYDDAIAESEQILAAALLDAGHAALDWRAQSPMRSGARVTLRWILVHLLEEYARHAGHADLIRESIDGATDL